MKRSHIVTGLIICALVISLTIQPVSASIKDVPTDHWAYQAVVSLVNRGFIATYEDGTFQGSKSVDRYTLASTVAKILDEVEAGNVRGTTADAVVLRELTVEFREELVQWYATQDDLNAQIAQATKAIASTDERLSNITAHQVSLNEEVARIKADIMVEAMNTSLSIEEQQNTIAAQAEAISTHQERIAELQGALLSIENALLLQESDINKLQNWSGEKDAVFAMLDSTMQITLDDLNTSFDETSVQIGAIKQDLDRLLTTAATTDGSLVKFQEQTKVQLDEITKRNQEIERDLQSLAVKLSQESKAASDNNAKLSELEKEVKYIATQVGISEDELTKLNKKISEEIAVQMNAAVIRERGLSTDFADLSAEFEAYKLDSQKEIKSAKSTAIIAIAAAAVGILIGFIK